MLENNFPEDKIKKVKNAMLGHSTKYRIKFKEENSKEGKILYDADKSTFLNTNEQIKKYSPLLYFQETKELVKKNLQ